MEKVFICLKYLLEYIYGEMEEGESLMTLICGGVQQHNIFQTICKWVVDNEAEWPRENEILFHLLKENLKKRDCHGRQYGS